jgi:hypothetical protein
MTGLGAAVASTTDEDLRAAAGIASLALTLLTFFTNMRREQLKAYLEDTDPRGWKVLLDAAPDLLLAFLTGGAAVALAPLFVGTVDIGEVGRRAGVISTLFALIWLGFCAVFLFQLWTVGRRIVASVSAA